MIWVFLIKTRFGFQTVGLWARVLAQVVVALLVTSCGSKSKHDPVRAELHLRNGTGLLEKRQYPAALRELLEANRLDSNSAVIKNNLGTAYFLRSRYKEAEDYYREALAMEPKYTDARNNLGRLLIELNRIPEAVTELKKASEDLTFLNPEKPLANLGLAYFKTRDYRTAQKILTDSLALRRDHCQTLNLFGRTYFELSEFAKAATALDQAAKSCLNENFDEPFYFSALSYLRMGRKSEAIARLEEALSKYTHGGYTEKTRQLLQSLR